MKTRIIQTRFWDDEFVNEADYRTRFVYLYVLTSQYINICGAFQLPIKKILFETGLTFKDFEVAQKELEKCKKVFFCKGWVFVTNARKNNKYENSPKNKECMGKEFTLIPKDVKEFFDSSIGGSIDSSMYTNDKSEIINNKSETRTNKQEEYVCPDDVKIPVPDSLREKVKKIGDFEN